MDGRSEKRNTNTETKVEFYFLRSAVSPTRTSEDYSENILFARRSSLDDEETFKKSQLKNLVLPMPSDYEIN